MTRPLADDLARKAYEAYGAVTDHKNYQGLPMPYYDALPETIRRAWEAAAAAVADTVTARAAAQLDRRAEQEAGTTSVWDGNEAAAYAEAAEIVRRATDD